MKDKKCYKDLIENENNYNEEDYDYDKEEYFEDYDYDEEIEAELEYNKDECIQYQTKKTTENYYSNIKNSLDNITHKEISRDIKKISINTYRGSVALIVIAGIIGLFCCIFGVMIEEGEPGLGLILSIICILAVVGLINTYYYTFLLSTGFAALIEDVNNIKKSLVKIDEESDFDDLPKL